MSHETVPQEIIHEIIAHLSDDLPALHACALSAYAFHLASRRHIFATVRLYTPATAQNLHALLAQSPDIAALVRTLHIYASVWEKACSPLPAVLPRLARVRRLVVGRQGYAPSMNWHVLPVAVRRAIEALVTSPALHTLVFTSVVYLPISILSCAAHVKTLKLYSVAFTEPVVPQPTSAPHRVGAVPSPTSPTTSTLTLTPAPLGLESIHCSSSMSNLSCPPLHAPHLRHYTIVGNSMANLLTVQKICTALSPACPIDDLTWLEYRGDDPYIDPGMLTCPHRLAFSTWTFDMVWAQRLPAMWASITRLLGNASLEALEEFSVTLRCARGVPVLMGLDAKNNCAGRAIGNADGADTRREGTYAYANANGGEEGGVGVDVNSACLGAPPAWWAHLDARLGDPERVPNLRAVTFGLEVVGGGVGEGSMSEGELALMLGERLPLLRGAGVLSVTARVAG